MSEEGCDTYESSVSKGLQDRLALEVERAALRTLGEAQGDDGDLVGDRSHTQVRQMSVPAPWLWSLR